MGFNSLVKYILEITIILCLDFLHQHTLSIQNMCTQIDGQLCKYTLMAYHFETIKRIEIPMDKNKHAHRQTVGLDDLPLLRRKMFPYKEVEKFEILLLPSCVSPAQSRVHMDHI